MIFLRSMFGPKYLLTTLKMILIGEKLVIQGDGKFKHRNCLGCGLVFHWHNNLVKEIKLSRVPYPDYFLNIKSLNLKSTKSEGKIRVEKFHQGNGHHETAFMLWAELSHTVSAPVHHKALHLRQCEQELKQKCRSIKD